MKPTDRRRAISVDRAFQRYAGSVWRGSAPCRADGDSIGQASNYLDAAERTELRAEQVRQVIMAHGVPLIQFVPYRNFGLHLDKLTRNHTDAALRNLAMAAVDYRTAYGLRPDVLKEVCRTGFNLETD
jgi:hypothetical protein